MSNTEYDAIFNAACQLPVDDRLRLIDELAASVPDDSPPSLSAEWIQEIQHRSGEIDAGTVVTEPWETVRQEVMRKVGLDRAD